MMILHILSFMSYMPLLPSFFGAVDLVSRNDILIFSYYKHLKYLNSINNRNVSPIFSKIDCRKTSDFIHMKFRYESIKKNVKHFLIEHYVECISKYMFDSL